MCRSVRKKEKINTKKISVCVCVCVCASVSLCVSLRSHFGSSLQYLGSGSPPAVGGRVASVRLQLGGLSGSPSMLNGKMSQAKGQGKGQMGKGHFAPKSWKCAGVAGCGHAWNLPASATCRSCGLHWDFNLRPSLKGSGVGAGHAWGAPGASQPVGTAAARAPWFKWQWGGPKGKGNTGCDGSEPGALLKACDILAELLGEEHAEVRTRREQLAALAASTPSSKAGLITTCDELAVILGEAHAEVVSRRKTILEMPDEESSVPDQKQLQNVLRNLDGLYKKHLTQSAKLANLEEQKIKLQTEIDGSTAFVLATQGRIDDAELLKTSIIAKCSKIEAGMEIDEEGGCDGIYPDDLDELFGCDDDIDPEHRDMLQKINHLKDTLAKLAKSKKSQRSTRDTETGKETPPAQSGPGANVETKPTTPEISTTIGDSVVKDKPTPTLPDKGSAPIYGKAPAVKQRETPFKTPKA
jgi:hypothetical protein